MLMRPFVISRGQLLQSNHNKIKHLMKLKLKHVHNINPDSTILIHELIACEWILQSPTRFALF